MSHTDKQRIILVKRSTKEDGRQSVEFEFPPDMTLEEAQGTIRNSVMAHFDMLAAYDMVYAKASKRLLIMTISLICNALMLVLFYMR